MYILYVYVYIYIYTSIYTCAYIYIYIYVYMLECRVIIITGYFSVIIVIIKTNKCVYFSRIAIIISAPTLIFPKVPGRIAFPNLSN